MGKIVVGLVGPIASGKGFLAEYLERQGFFHLVLSDRLREELARLGKTITRDALVELGNSWRDEFGNDVLARKSLALVPGGVVAVVIEGIRNPGEILFLKNFWKAVIVGVDAPEELRLKLYLDRARKRGEDEANEAEFWRVNARDLGQGEDVNGQQGQACFEMADIKLENDGTNRFLQEGMEYLRTRGFGVEGGAAPKEVSR